MNSELDMIDLLVQFEQQSFAVFISQEASLKQLIAQVQQIINIPASNLLITYYEKPLLKQHMKLRDLGIGSNSVLRLNRVGSRDFAFNDMKNRKEKSVTYGPRSHRSIKKGLILYAICDNKKCQVYGLKCCINKQMGSFQLGKQVHKCFCPICKQKAKKALGLGYYSCKIKMQGVRQNGEQFKYEGQAKNQVHKFDGDDKDISKWCYLDIVTQPL